MNRLGIVHDVFKTVGEVAKKSDFLSHGLNEHDVSALLKQGYIEWIRHGYHRLAASDEFQEESLLSAWMTQGIVCVESALFHYGYMDFAPRQWSIAVPRSCSRTVKAIREEVPVKACYIQSDLYHLGETSGLFNGVTLPVYDRERTICDCFKYRTNLDHELFNKAVNAYALDEKKNLANLSRYAKEMGVYQELMNVMDVLLNR